MLALRLPHLRHRAQLLTANGTELIFRLLGGIALRLRLLLRNTLFLVVGFPIVLVFLFDAPVVAAGRLGANGLDLFLHCFQRRIRHHDLLLARLLCNPDLLNRSESFPESVNLLLLPFLFRVLF